MILYNNYNNFRNSSLVQLLEKDYRNLMLVPHPHVSGRGSLVQEWLVFFLDQAGRTIDASPPDTVLAKKGVADYGDGESFEHLWTEVLS